MFNNNPTPTPETTSAFDKDNKNNSNDNNIVFRNFDDHSSPIISKEKALDFISTQWPNYIAGGNEAQSNNQWGYSGTIPLTWKPK
ncbi:MAG: hypothetical protein ABFC28_03900 [Rikenellaceae bacterium]